MQDDESTLEAEEALEAEEERNAAGGRRTSGRRGAAAAELVELDDEANLPLDQLLARWV